MPRRQTSRHANPQLDKGFVIGVNLNISAYDRVEIVLASNAKNVFLRIRGAVEKVDPIV